MLNVPVSGGKSTGSSNNALALTAAATPKNNGGSVN